LIEAINNGLSAESIPGTAYIVNDNIKINTELFLTEEELNALPFPAWELIDQSLYARKSSFATVGCRPYATIITSRGCPFHCVYCHQTMGKVFRKRSAESVLAEMEFLLCQHGYKEIEIVDDCFNLDRERMHAILNGIIKRFGEIKLHFPNGLRADILEPDELALFKKAGTVSACFAIDTSSPRLQKMIKRNLNIEKAFASINASVKEGIYTTVNFMLGFPTETYEEACNTVNLASRSSLHRAMFMRVTPFVGTELADMVDDILKERYNIDGCRCETYFNGSVNISAMSDDELNKIFRRAYMRLFFTPKRISRLAFNHPRKRSLPRYAGVTLVKILSGGHSSLKNVGRMIPRRLFVQK
jgi:radical SAM superfamily enzyme YgiQ (UPF0313 family)